MFYITQIYGVVLQQAIPVTLHIQSDVGGKILYVADLEIGRGFVITASKFDLLIKNILNKVHIWRNTIFDDSSPITNPDDVAIIQEKIKNWYGISYD
jgi:hypothetical protein